MQKMKMGLLASSMLLAAGVAGAQPVTGPYVSGSFGYNITNDPDIGTQSGLAVRPINGQSLYNPGGFAGLGALGFGFGNGWRAEIEGNYRSQNMGLNSTAGVGLANGKHRTYGVMVNALYDFNMGWAVYPYLGAGVGYEWSAVGGAISSGGSFSGNRGGLGVQGIAGIAYPLDFAPGLSLTGEYRILARPYSDNNNFGGGTVRTGSTFDQSFLVGLRYAFNSPAAPLPAYAAAPAPAPAPARTYLVFFDWDKSDLSARARQIIADASQASTKVATTRIEVNGNADKTGTAAYNVALSKRRGDAVAAELVRDGVPANRIYITANGDTRPIVPTAPGVREPQNRNVEIVLK